MHNIRRVLIATLAILGSALADAQSPGSSPIAGGLSVAPVQLSLNSVSRSVSTLVSNPGGEPLTVQVRLYSWTMNGEEEAYGPVTDAGFSPPLFRLEPHATQAVRVVAKVPPGPVERSYRLVIDQLPLAEMPGQLQLPVRMVLPVFVEPAPGIARIAELRWSAHYDPKSHRMRITVSNRGAVHVRIVDLRVEEGSSSRLIAAGLAGYALAGQVSSWAYKVDDAPQSLTVIWGVGAATTRAMIPVHRQ